MLLHALQISGEAVRVKHHAEHIVSCVPVADLAARLVPLAKLDVPLLEALFQHRNKIVERLLVIVIHFHIEPFQLVHAGVKAFMELLQILLLGLRPLALRLHHRSSLLFRRLGC